MSPDLHHLTGAYAVDALDADERSAFEEHLAGCPACRAEVAELTDAAHTLGALADATPPAALRQAVLTGISQVRPLPPVVPGDTTRDDEVGGLASPDVVGRRGAPSRDSGAKADTTVVPLFRRAATWVAAAAAAAVLAVGGVVWGPWSSDEPTLTALEQVEQAADARTVSGQAGDATATLAYSRTLDRSALTVTGLPAAPEGSVYQLWYIGDAEVRSAGFLTTGADGRGEAVLDGSLVGASKVGVTVEPEGGSVAPTTEPVVVMALA